MDHYPTARRDSYTVVIGADTFPPDVNGAAAFGQNLAHGLAGQGHRVHVLCPSPDGEPHTSTVGSLTVHRLPSYRSGLHPTLRVCLPRPTERTVAELLDQLAPDVVHIQSHFLVGRALVEQAERRAIPVVATNHFMPENLFAYLRLPDRVRTAAARILWRDLRRVYGRVQAVTTPTQRAADLLRANGVGGPIRPISCGIDLDRYRPAQAGTGPGSPVPTVLFVGRLDAEKRVDELLRALALLPAELPLRAEIVGQGACRGAWERLAGELGVADRVVFRGYLDDDALLAAYRRCDVFCMPGVAELQSLVTLEAMASGKPVVAADAMALPHLVRPGENGWLYTPGGVRELAGHLGRLAADPAARARLGEAGRRIAETHSAAATVSAFEELYEGLLLTSPVPRLVAA